MKWLLKNNSEAELKTAQEEAAKVPGLEAKLKAAQDEAAKAAQAAPVSDSVGIEGTWKMTDLKDYKVPGLSEDEVKQQMAEAKQQLRDGLVNYTLTFKDGKVTITVKVDGSVTGSGTMENTATGTYRNEGDKIIATQDGSEESGEPMEFRINGNTLEMISEAMTAVLTRQ